MCESTMAKHASKPSLRNAPCWSSFHPLVFYRCSLFDVCVCLGEFLHLVYIPATMTYLLTQDFLMDWSLLKPHAQYPLLRPELVYKSQIPVRPYF